MPASLFIFFTLCRLATKQDRKIAGDDPNPFSLYFLILFLLAFLFSYVVPFGTSLSKSHLLPTCEWPWKKPYFVPASLFIFFTLCRLATKQDHQIAGDDPIPFSLYFLILCLLAFLFSLLCAVWLSKRVSPKRTSAPRASDLEIDFYVFPYFVPASLFIFCTLCRRLATKQDRKIAGDDPNPFSLYFLILCLLDFLFSLLAKSHLRPTYEWPWNFSSSLYPCPTQECTADVIARARAS